MNGIEHSMARQPRVSHWDALSRTPATTAANRPRTMIEMSAMASADAALAVKNTGAGSGVDFISRSCFWPRSLASEMPKPRTITLATP